MSFEKDILEQLDYYAGKYDFPAFDNSNYPATAMRLTAFRSSSEWLIVFEDIACDINQGLFVHMTYAYGNTIDRPGLQSVYEIIKEPEDKPFWDDRQNFLLDPWNFVVMIGGKPMKFSPSINDYERAGMDISNMNTMLRTMRLLFVLIPDELFLSDQRLLEICHKSKSNLERFIKLVNWSHPDIVGGEKPSENICLQSLAHSLSANTQTYRCPETSINTHWSYWENRIYI